MGPEPNGPHLVSCNRAAIDTQVEGLILSGSCWRFLGDFSLSFQGVPKGPNCYAMQNKLTFLGERRFEQK